MGAYFVAAVDVVSSIGVAVHDGPNASRRKSMVVQSGVCSSLTLTEVVVVVQRPQLVACRVHGVGVAAVHALVIDLQLEECIHMGFTPIARDRFRYSLLRCERTLVACMPVELLALFCRTCGASNNTLHVLGTCSCRRRGAVE